MKLENIVCRRKQLASFQVSLTNIVKNILYPIHTYMAQKGYNEIHVHQENDYISIHRTHPITHDGYLLIARTAFKGQNEGPGILN